MNGLKRYYIFFAIFGLLLAVLFVVIYFRDTDQDWKKYQLEYKRRELAKATTPQEKQRIKRMPIEIKQIIIPQLGRVDRCMTCHISVEDPTYAQADLPFRYHVNHSQHPFEKFGCTICHGGQGLAVDKKDAHGNVPHWSSPILPMEYITASCGKCHIPTEVPDAPELAKGEQLFEEKGCHGCHKLNGFGNTIGPDLTEVGRHRDPDWLMRHFLDPNKVTPGTVMPKFGFTVEEAKALTIFMLSQTDEPISGYYASKKVIPNVNYGRILFLEKGCIGCHNINGVGGKVGPDLAKAIQHRTSDWIFKHFKDPQAVSPGTVMPKFDFTDGQAKALTMFIVSLGTPKTVGFIQLPQAATPEERGKLVFKKYGCAGCHGLEGKGGVKNPNSQGGVVPSLTRVAEGYTKDELEQKIRLGVPQVAKADPKGPIPPLYMPSWKDKISQQELDDLTAYLFSLMPKGEKEEW